MQYPQYTLLPCNATQRNGYKNPTFALADLEIILSLCHGHQNTLIDDKQY